MKILFYYVYTYTSYVITYTYYILVPIILIYIPRRGFTILFKVIADCFIWETNLLFQNRSRNSQVCRTRDILEVILFLSEMPSTRSSHSNLDFLLPLPRILPPSSIKKDKVKSHPIWQEWQKCVKRKTNSSCCYIGEQQQKCLQANPLWDPAEHERSLS